MTRPAKSRRPDRLVTVEAIEQTGLRIADAEGLDAVSMRRIADELGVGAMTLYSYVRSKEELLDGIATRVLEQLPPDHEGSWQERLEFAAHHLHVALREHPGVAQIIASRHGPIPALDRFRETMLGILDDAGFPSARAVQVLSSLAAYTAGFAHVEQYRAGAEPAVEAQRLRRLPRDEFPRLSAAADDYAGHVSQDAFTLGLRAFVAGLDPDSR